MHDVLIVGAGISGVGMACHLRMNCPDKSFTILERRQRVGGTWDLFRYPGIRSDADMFTFGFGFKPWRERKILGDAATIRDYVQEAAQEHDVYDQIQFGQKVTNASWSTEDCCWTLTTVDEASGAQSERRGRFLVMGSGYYNHDEAYNPPIPGEEDFGGEIIHPQFWPEGLDYSGKKVVVIGSGATAVTLIPAMAEDAGHVTMLQRSPSYIISLPDTDRVSPVLRKVLSDEQVNELVRGFYIRLFKTMWGASKRSPKAVRKLLLKLVERQVGKEQMPHFDPEYDPWDQRLCLVPSNDLFKAMKSGKASVATGHIETITQGGVRLKSGEELTADIIVKATGLELQMLGGTQVTVDGERQDISQLMQYKGSLIENLPNFSWVFGYVSYPWTLKADLVAQYVCRLLDYMDEQGHEMVVPVDEQGCRTEGSLLCTINSGYVQRGGDRLPRNGNRAPWEVLNDYPRDRKTLLKGPIEDAALKFSSPLSVQSAGRQPVRKVA